MTLKGTYVDPFKITTSDGQASIAWAVSDGEHCCYCDTKVHKVTELMMMARRAMSKLNFPRFVSLYPKRILVWGSVSLRVASDKAREIQFGHSPSCHHHQFCHFMNFSDFQTLCLQILLKTKFLTEYLQSIRFWTSVNITKLCWDLLTKSHEKL